PPALEVGGAAVDEPLRLVVRGLARGEKSTIWVRMTDDRGQVWTSWGTYAADGAGRVDVATQASTSGSYTGTDPAGLLWSMRLPRGAPVVDPRPVLNGPEMRLDIGVDVDGRTAARASLVRRLHEPGVTAVPIAESGLVGDLYLPPGPGPHPGVILLGGSEGG